MNLNTTDIVFLALGSVVGILAILTASYPAVIAGYFLLVLGALITFVVAIHEGRHSFLVSKAAKLFVGFGGLVWLLTVPVAAILAVFA